jgi:hypothetical protein
MLSLQVPSSLYRATVARIAEAHAGAGGGQASRVQQVRPETARPITQFGPGPMLGSAASGAIRTFVEKSPRRD